MTIAIKFFLRLLPALLFAPLAHSSIVDENPKKVSDAYCCFIPPKDWKLASPSLLSSRVKVSFLGKGKNAFCPSLNLSVENVDLSLDAYVDIVKGLHQKDRNNEWRDLGTFNTQAGKARLTSIDTQNEAGSVRLLQLILVKDKKAYILTAGALKEELPQFYEAFRRAFASLTLSQDLLSLIPDNKRQEEIKKRLASLQQERAAPEFQKKHLLPFKTYVIDSFADLGAYWQLLLLQQCE